MPVVHRHDPPERFVAGTVGPPGQRTFFLQARTGARLTSVALEKQQVAVLAERLESLLDEVMRSEGGAATVPAVTPAGMEDNEPLEQPIEEEFRAGTMTLAWDNAEHRVVIEVFAMDESALDPTVESDPEQEEDLSENEVLVVTLPPPLARALSQRAQAVLAAGRPPCQFCGDPIDPSRHPVPQAD